MSHKIMLYGSLAAFLLATILFLFLSCVSAPPNPYDFSNTKIYLTLKSSGDVIGADTLVDSVGNSIKVGITANFPDYMDSVGLMVFTSDGNEEIDTVLKNLVLLKNQDTLWYKATFATSGKRTLIATAFVEGNNKYSIKGYFNILDKPIKPVLRAWPHLVVNKTINITSSQTCSLTVSVLDSNPAQTHSFYVKQDTQPQTVFTPPTFKWTPPSGFIGTSTVFFKVSDSDSPAFFDTETVIITVTAAIDTSHPVQTAPTADNQNLSTKKNAALSITLTANASTGVTLSNWTIVTNPTNGTLTGTAPSLIYTPNSGFIGFDSLTFTVSDGKNTSNAAKIKINVSDVLVSPTVGKTIPDISVNKGLAASFVATVNPDANPSPAFSWFKEGSTAPVSTCNQSN